jgi:tetratricopeptide (TPR) repeat protein
MDTQNILYDIGALYSFSEGATKYLVARALFLNGEYDQSKNLYKEVIGSEPKHVDSYYGLSEVYRLSGNEDKARDILTQVLTISCRLKTWLLLANLVNVEKDYIQLINLWAVEHLHWNIPKYHYDVNDYLIVAALRAKKYEDALLIVKELLENESSDSFFSRHQ